MRPGTLVLPLVCLITAQLGAQQPVTADSARAPRQPVAMDSVRAAQLYVSNRPEDAPVADYAREIVAKRRTDSIYAARSAGVMEFKKITYHESDSTLLVLEKPSKANKLYPYLTKANEAKVREYMAMLPPNVHSIGRLGTYKYSTIEQTIIQAFSCVAKITGKPNEMEGEWRGIGDVSLMKDRKESQ